MLRDIWGDYFFFVYACVGCVPVGVWKPEEHARCLALSFPDYSLDVESLESLLLNLEFTPPFFFFFFC